MRSEKRARPHHAEMETEHPSPDGRSASAGEPPGPLSADQLRWERLAAWSSAFSIVQTHRLLSEPAARWNGLLIPDLLVLAISLGGMGVIAPGPRRRLGPDPERAILSRMEKGTWQMLPLAELTRPTWSAARKVGMFTLHLSLVIAVVLMVIKVIQLALRSQREERSIFFCERTAFQAL